jgi:hypothetical protein
VKVAKGKLKAKMLEYFREVERTGEPLVVTDNGREVLEVRSMVGTHTAAEVLAEYRSGKGKGVSGISEEELLKPVEPAEEWEVLRENDSNPW